MMPPLPTSPLPLLAFSPAAAASIARRRHAVAFPQLHEPRGGRRRHHVGLASCDPRGHDTQRVNPPGNSFSMTFAVVFLVGMPFHTSCGGRQSCRASTLPMPSDDQLSCGRRHAYEGIRLCTCVVLSMVIVAGFSAKAVFFCTLCNCHVLAKKTMWVCDVKTWRAGGFVSIKIN